MKTAARAYDFFINLKARYSWPALFRMCTWISAIVNGVGRGRLLAVLALDIANYIMTIRKETVTSFQLHVVPSVK